MPRSRVWLNTESYKLIANFVPLTVLLLRRPKASYWKLAVRPGPAMLVNWSRLFQVYVVVPPVSVNVAKLPLLSYVALVVPSVRRGVGSGLALPHF